jgi:lipopolysaccharide transport system ATP-binding protein
MSDIAIKVVGLSKRFRIGANQQLYNYKTLRDRIASTASAPFRGAKHLLNGNGNGWPVKRNPRSETIWALDDVSFEIEQGEVVGIIGRNGAGKSTLLKILSRITEPTKGYADIFGRVGSLLEVGTGFQPELTGRENIFLNGSILGMRNAEIKKKFDQIVAFAEVEKFIDTPVKHYSSGMYVRLAFAVAAHLDPEILLVDEVLAVGDAAFRKKCLGKMDDVARQGRTVLFVSHDMTNIATLCRQAILLGEGRVLNIGPAHSVIADYLAEKNVDRSCAEWPLSEAPGGEIAKLTKVEVSSGSGPGVSSFNLSEPITLLMEFAVLKDGVRLNPVFVVKNHLGASIFSSSNYEEAQWSDCPYDAGKFTTSCHVPAHILNEGKYSVDAMLVQEMRSVKAECESAVGFSVFDDGTTRGDYVGEWVGIVRPRCEWQTTRC